MIFWGNTGETSTLSTKGVWLWVLMREEKNIGKHDPRALRVYQIFTSSNIECCFDDVFWLGRGLFFFELVCGLHACA
jgi:hypothetical protein